MKINSKKYLFSPFSYSFKTLEDVDDEQKKNKI